MCKDRNDKLQQEYNSSLHLVIRLHHDDTLMLHIRVLSRYVCVRCEFSSPPQCQVILIHIIKDANTKCPEPDKMNYSVDIKEDFMPGYIISNFKVSRKARVMLGRRRKRR